MQDVEGRSSGSLNLVGPRQRLVQGAAPQRQPGAQQPHRPFIPVTGLPAICAVRFFCPPEKLAGDLVATAYQVNLRQRVEPRPGGFVKLNGTAHLERPMQRLLGAGQIPETHTDLSERGERDREPVAGAVFLVKRDAAFRQGKRLLVAMLEHHDVGLVPADSCQHVVGMDERGEPLRMP